MKRRILEVIRQGQIGGGETHLLDLVDLMDKERFEPICLSFTDGEMISRMRAMGIECHIIETTKPFDFRIQKQIKQLMSKHGIELVHAHGSRAASNIIYAARQLHLPVVYTVHGWSFHDDQSFLVKKLRAWSEKLICSLVQRVICVSQSNADTGREVFGLRQCDVIENGINLNRFNPTAPYPDLRPEFGFADDDFIVGFIARNTKQKAPLDFLAAVKAAHQQDAHLKALFVGEGDMDKETAAFIAANDMSAYVCQSKFRLDVPALLHCIDAYCLPSLWEGLSIALLEAMAMEKAIIATPTDGTRELLTDGDNGLIVGFNNPQQLAAAMLRYKNEPDTKKRCGENARLLVAQRYNAQRVADAVADVYTTLLK